VLSIKELGNVIQLTINAHEGDVGTPEPICPNEKVHRVKKDCMEIEYVTAEIGDTFYLCYEGTSSLMDWIKDFTLAKDKFHCYDVHKGFLEQYDTVKSEVKPLIRRKNLAGKRIILCGHSLGAALATLTALDVLETNAIKCELGLIACPKIGTTLFANTINRHFPDLVRFVNKNDIIDVLPPNMFGFKHIGERIVFGSRWLGLNPLDHSPVRYQKSYNKYFK